MALQESKARAAQRTRQLKKPQPVRVQRRTGRTKLSVKKTVPAIQAGIPAGLAALAKKQREKKVVRKVEEAEKRKAGSQNSPFQKVNPPKFSAVSKLGKLSV